MALKLKDLRDSTADIEDFTKELILGAAKPLPDVPTFGKSIIEQLEEVRVALDNIYNQWMRQ